MLHRILADGVVVLHLAFVLFVVGGGFVALRWPRVAVAHLPAAVWGALIELGGWVCPLTPLENWLRTRAGGATYAGGFVERYLLPVLYPGELTREIQVALGVFVILLNGAVYARILWRSSGREERE